MPGLAHRNEHYSCGFKDVDGVSYNQLHKFWSELSPEARHELLRIDRQALLELARKNMCCSKCIGLLLEGFLHLVSHGKSMQQKGDLPCNRSGASKHDSSHRCSCELQDPSVHRWGGLTATHDGSLTLLDCYLFEKSFKGLQTVFESGRARERERELLYPHACGSQRMVGYGKGHGTRETCALHTTRLSCDTLVAFCSALDEESRQSVLRMKEEDFIERLTNRFKRKKFCKDCRRNVIREFKELKELKRMQKEPQCTDWFCVADTAIQYEVDNDSVRADWSQYFKENDGYQYIEWGIGTEEGETDILKYKYVGNDGSGQVSGLDLRGLRECYITVRAFKDSGCCSEVSVKAHALRGQQCVHSWLVVGDGFVSVKRGECIRMLFDHAEDVEEEEDEVMVDKDGNEVAGERPQKHAKTPELAREFLLNAASVIFKEQVEKACRESAARQNAQSVFVCISCKLLEQRVHIACKEIVTLEKQKELLEEEEKEKEQKGRKRTKEREKKLRRKERLKEKEQKNPMFGDKPMLLPVLSREEEGFLNLDEEMDTSVSCEESVNETGDVVDLSPPGSPVEKHEEEERKRRKRTKDKEKKLRRKERLKEKDQKNPKFSDKPMLLPVLSREEEVFVNLDEEMSTSVSCEESASGSPDDKDGDCLGGCTSPRAQTQTHYCDSNTTREVIIDQEDGNGCFTTKEEKKMEDDMYLKGPMMSRTSSSDSCSSCITEGDSNGNTESSSVSDSEDASLHSEGRENLILMTEKETEKKSTDERDLLRIKNMSNLSADTGSYMSQQQSSMMFPQMPVPGYYHQAPVSWSAAPTKRLMPFPPPHPNPYVYTGPLGYVLNGESTCGTPLNPSATPFFNSRPAPVSHNTMNTVDQGHILEPLEAADERRDMETPSSRGSQTDSEEDFSLFHFGGPVAMSTGCKSSHAHSKDGTWGDFSLQFTGNCKKKKESSVGEEYNLFAKSNILRFSIF